MPRKNLAGTFEGAPHFRWKRMIKGQVFRLLCRAKKANEKEKPNCGYLGLPESKWTKADSQAAANEWWGKFDTPDWFPEWDAKVQKLARVVDNLGIVPGNPIIPELWRNIDTVKTEKVVENQTVGFHLDRFLELERKSLKPQSFRELRQYMEQLTEQPFFVRTKGVAEIDSTTVDEHYLWLAGKYEAGGHNKRLGFFRRFVAWLDEREFITAPRNLKSKKHRMKDPAKAVRKYTGVADVVASLPAHCRLWAMLGLNCGMTQADWGALQWSDMDLKKGTLIRLRVKLESVKNAPTVTYKLWPSTLALLREHRAKTPKSQKLVFVTSTGRPMYVVEYKPDGTEKKTDYFSTVWNRLETKPAISPAKYRNVATTALNRMPEYRGFHEIFLANTPTDITFKHYAAEHDESFWKALAWLGKELGV